MDRGQTLPQAEEEWSYEQLCRAPPHHLDRWEKHQEAPGRRHHQPGRTKVRGHFRTDEVLQTATNHAGTEKRFKKQLQALITRNGQKRWLCPSRKELGCLDRCLTGDLSSFPLYQLLWRPRFSFEAAPSCVCWLPSSPLSAAGSSSRSRRSCAGAFEPQLQNISHWSANGPSSTARTAAGDEDGGVFFPLAVEPNMPLNFPYSSYFIA